MPSVRAPCARPFRNEGVSDCIFSIAILRVVNMACSSSGSTHGLQAMHCNQLAVRDQLDIAGREGLPETWCRQSIELTLTMLAHLRKWKGDVHIDQRAELMVVDANMSDDEIERRIETRDHC